MVPAILLAILLVSPQLPGPPPCFHPSGRAAYAGGWAAYVRGDFARAARLFEQAEQAEPECVEALFRVGQTYYALAILEPDHAHPFLRQARRAFQRFVREALDHPDLDRAEAYLRAIQAELRPAVQ